VFEEARTKYGTRISFERVNAEAPENAALMHEWGVRGYPTIIFIDESGQMIDKVPGYMKPPDFDARINKNFPQ